MDKKRRREIDSVVQKTLKRCNAINVPRNPVSLCSALNLNARPITDLDLEVLESAQLKIAPAFTVRDSRTIYYDPGIHSPYPIAHEIAHLILGHNHDGPENEEEANYAAGLLVSAKASLHPAIKTMICLAFSATLVAASFAVCRSNQMQPSNTVQQTSQSQISSSSCDSILMSKSDISEDEIVYITPKGIRYHLSESCAGPTATPTTLKEAENLGRTPCKICIGE